MHSEGSETASVEYTFTQGVVVLVIRASDVPALVEHLGHLISFKSPRIPPTQTYTTKSVSVWCGVFEIYRRSTDLVVQAVTLTYLFDSTLSVRLVQRLAGVK
jgi:hypothetical protein